MPLSNCNWGNQAQLKQPCSLYSGTHVNIGVRGINLACLATCNEEAHGVCISWIHPRSCDVMHSIFWPNYQTKVNFENHYRLWDEFWISEFFLWTYFSGNMHALLVDDTTNPRTLEHLLSSLTPHQSSPHQEMVLLVHPPLDGVGANSGEFHSFYLLLE